MPDTSDGAFVTGMPRSRAAARSIPSTPTPNCCTSRMRLPASSSRPTRIPNGIRTVAERAISVSDCAPDRIDQPCNAALSRSNSRPAQGTPSAICRSIIVPRQGSRSPCQVFAMSAEAGPLRTERSRILLQLGPGFSAVLLLPFRIEPCLRQSFAEWGFVRVVEGQPLLLEGGLELRIQPSHILALLGGCVTEPSRNELPHILGQSIPSLSICCNPISIPDVSRHRAVLLNLVDLHGIDLHERVFLAVHDLGLQGGIEFSQADRRWRCSQSFEHRNPERGGRHPDLQILKVLDLLDRLGAGRDVAKAIIKAPREEIEATRLDRRSDVCAEVTVHRRPDLRVVLEGEWHGVNPSDRHKGLHDGPGGRHELDRPRPKLIEHLSFSAELRVREHRDVNVAAGLLLDLFTGLDHARRGGMGRRKLNSELQPGWCGLSEDVLGVPAARGDCAKRNRTKPSTCEVHGSLPGFKVP